MFKWTGGSRTRARKQQQQLSQLKAFFADPTGESDPSDASHPPAVPSSGEVSYNENAIRVRITDLRKKP